MKRANKAFTLAEMLIVTAVMIIIAAVLIPVSLRMRLQFQARLDESLVARICESIEQYRAEKGVFPFESQNVAGLQEEPLTETQLLDMIEQELTGQASTNAVTVSGAPADPADHALIASSEMLYFKLSRCGESAAALSRLPEKQLTAENPEDNTARVIASYNGTDYILTRFVDTNGIAVKYYYKAEWSFPRIVAAGLDKTFFTEDDITNY